MAWKKHVKLWKNQNNLNKLKSIGDYSGGLAGKTKSPLQDIYRGKSNRKDRYNQFDVMDSDPVISTCLNVISDFCTQNNTSDTTIPFDIEYDKEVPAPMVKSINKMLKRWTYLNEFDVRIFDIVRGVIKYGDQFFIRDPETYKWQTVDPRAVESVVVDSIDGKRPVQYMISNLELNNLENVATDPIKTAHTNRNFPSAVSASTQTSGFGPSLYPTNALSAGYGNTVAVDANHVVHVTTATGMDIDWPFGRSMLERLYKAYKQKDLIQDAMLIYRIVRAPERRVYKINVGDAMGNSAMEIVRRFKDELHQRRMPTKNQDGRSFLETGYDAQAITEDFYLPVNGDGLGPDITTLPGGTALSDIDDMRYFNNELIRGLDIPVSYIPQGLDTDTHSWNDGRIGQVMTQEIRFAKQCLRIQNLIAKTFDKEFKVYLMESGYEFEPEDFRLRFYPPTNFAEWTYLEIMNSRVSLFSDMDRIGIFSRRLLLRDVMNWSEDQIEENERLFIEENPEALQGKMGDITRDTLSPGPGLDALGVSDLDDFDDMDMDEFIDTEEPEDMDMDMGPDMDIGEPTPEPEEE